MKYLGYNPPFLTDGGLLSKQSDLRLIKNDLKQLLLTVPGERVMNPFFGGPIKGFLFEQVNKRNTEVLRSEIAEAIKKYEPRIKIVNLYVLGSDDGESASIVLEFLVPSLEVSSNVVLELD